MLQLETPVEKGVHRRYRIPLAWRILLSSSALLVTLIGVVLLYVGVQAYGVFVTDRITTDLVKGADRIDSAMERELFDLTLTARLIASFPSLEALLSVTDQRTIRDFLLEYQHQNQRYAPDLLVVLDPGGHVLARTDSSDADPVEGIESWIKPALSDQNAQGALTTQGTVYNAAMVPCAAAGTVFGFVLAGTRMDNGLAAKLSDVSHDEIVILGQNVIGSTIPVSILPWKSRAGWKPQAGNNGTPAEVRIGSEAYSALAAALTYPGAPIVIALQSNDKALAPYHRIQLGLLILGVLAMAAGIGGSALLARHLTTPIGALVEGTREVARGNFDFQLKVDRGDEIGDLAESFNNMTRGLSERADMQKFVSQSTIEMIQSSRRTETASERKVLTIFFSDIRGFTTLSEQRDPAEVVKILNQIFTLQAQYVQKFSGDIDKYVGDCIVALFQGEDAPLNAIRCAAEIHKAMRGYNSQLPPGGPTIELGVGISTGEVILGSIGSEDRRDFTAIGSHVNLCARLCALAKAGEILLSEATYRSVEDFVAGERLEPQHVKGFSEPVPVYRIAARS